MSIKLLQKEERELQEEVGRLQLINEECVIKTQALEEENTFKKEEVMRFKVKAKALQKEYNALVKVKDDKG
jgi:hypothetical protein